MNCWGYRIANEHAHFLYSELKEGRLRQGWGYDPGQDLRNLTVDNGARRNLAMLRNVKKGDLLLIPHLAEWGQIVIAEATEDWETGYRFDIDPQRKDFGHIFPAKKIKIFSKHAPSVNAAIRSTFRFAGRFWSLSHLKDDIEDLLKKTEEQLRADLPTSNKANQIALKPFDEDFKRGLKKAFDSKFQNAEWEYLLVEVFQTVYPFARVERVGGRSESQHGTDILITFPSLSSECRYAIAVQVKDHTGAPNHDCLDQIIKAEYWGKLPGLKLIDRVVAIIGIDKNASEVSDFSKKADEKGITILYSSDIECLLLQYACAQVSGQSDVNL